MTNNRSTNRLKRQFFRNGPDYRFGDQASFDEIKTTFGFKTITLGAWVSKEEQYIAANLLYDALADLTQILSLPPVAIGLRGTLNLAFGSGGQAGVQAHYDSNKRTLALAKNAGGGALAHEWWHAFDHYIAKHMFHEARAHDFASALWLVQPPILSHPLNEQLDALFRLLFLSSSANEPSDYFKHAVLLDKARGGQYYAKPQELTARAFEWVIANHPQIHNAFLVDDVLDSTLQLQGGFPDPSIAAATLTATTNYFQMLGAALYRQAQ
ncbi:CLCA_X family protein [Pseudoalteromonas rubra]|uniref:CLCA_X family protein n=1 Tax=Pseudoalteromonas rubra TaxID=43658 RepID=UPI000F77E18B|nr:CLCA_X family protein [Pseudoalteromonas rubra]